MSETQRMNRLVGHGYFPKLDLPPMQSTALTLVDATALELPKDTYRLYVGTGGDLEIQLIGDDGFRVLKNIPNGATIEGMFHQIKRTLAADPVDDIVAFHLPEDPAEA